MADARTIRLDRSVRSKGGTMRARSMAAGVLALSLVAAACGGDDDEPAAEVPADEPTEEPADEPAEPADEPAEAPASNCDPLPTVEDGVLTVATGETVFPPWMGAGEDDFDDPTTGTGYEGALVF